MGNDRNLTIEQERFKDADSVNDYLTKIKIPKGGIIVMRVGDEAHEPTSAMLVGITESINKMLGKKFKKHNAVAVVLPYWMDITLIGGGKDRKISKNG